MTRNRAALRKRLRKAKRVIRALHMTLTESEPIYWPIVRKSRWQRFKEFVTGKESQSYGNVT